MKHEWRKKEKNLYLPKNKPELITVPPLKFFSIKGQCNPNDELFGEYIQVLYSVSYTVRMSHKQGNAPDGYFEYTVYPLEGVWDLTEEGKRKYNGTIDKNELVFNLMIRQPDFVSDEFAAEIIEKTKIKKPHDLLDQLIFETIEEGNCVQMLHLGSYDDEPESFRQMEKFAEEQGVKRKELTHREIYLTDARKTDPAKLKTTLRFLVD